MVKRKVQAKITRYIGKRRRYAVPRRVPRAIGNRYPMLKLNRTTWAFNWTPNTTTTDGFWKLLTWRMNLTHSLQDFTGLFDQFKLYALKWKFMPRYDNFSGNDTTDTTVPGVTNQGACRMHILVDPFTSVAPTGTYTAATLNTFLENGNRVKTFSGNRPFSVFTRTCVDSAGERKRAPWLNITETAAVHYGIHAFAQDVNLTGIFGQSWDVFVTAYMMFKNAR